MLKTTQITLTFISLVTLTACSSAPSDGEIKSAIDKQMQADKKALGKLADNDMFNVEIKNVKKIGCKESGEKAFMCDVELFVSKNGVENKGVRTMKFVKASDGWVVQL